MHKFPKQFRIRTETEFTHVSVLKALFGFEQIVLLLLLPTKTILQRKPFSQNEKGNKFTAEP